MHTRSHKETQTPSTLLVNLQANKPIQHPPVGVLQAKTIAPSEAEHPQSQAQATENAGSLAAPAMQHRFGQVAIWPKVNPNINAARLQQPALLQRTPDTPEERRRVQEANTTLANRYQGGIEVTIALRPNRAEIQDGIPGVIAGSPTISQFIARYQHKLGDTQRQSLRIAFEALQTELTSTGDRPTREADAQLATEYDYYNDLEFERMAAPHASANNAIALDNGELKEGRHTPFERTEDPIDKVKNTSSFVASAANDNASTPHNISKLSIFTHGWHSGLQLGAFRSRHMGAGVANQLKDHFASNVNIMLYACSAASQDDSFAETLASTLASNGISDVRVFGHTTAAHTTRNPRGREFVAHNEAGAVTIQSHTNQELIFDTAFVDAEAHRICDEIKADTLPSHVTAEQVAALSVAQVRGTIEAKTGEWLIRHMPSIQVGARGVASYVIGSHRTEAIQAVRTFWQQPVQGKKTVFDTLFPVHRRRRRRG